MHPKTESKYGRQKLRSSRKKITDRFTKEFGDFRPLFSVTDTYGRQKIHKDLVELNSIINQFDLIDIYRTFHPRIDEYTICSSSHGIFTKKNPIQGHKAHFNTFKRIEIIRNKNILKLS